MFKTGIGYDIHRLVSGRPLVLGGVRVPFEKGLEGHSDADVLVHAVCDALLGAMVKGDIGEHFPDTDSRYKDIDSMTLLKQVMDIARQEGYSVVNIDAVILAEAPKLAPFKEDMRKNIASAAGVAPDQVNVKATTQEGVGFGSGAQEAMAAYAVVLIKRRESQ